MANEQNLKPIKQLSREEAKKRGRNGGIASGKARKERKLLKDELLFLLEQDDIQEKMCFALISQARRGNTKAFEIIRDTIGQKPVDEIEVNSNIKAAVEKIDALVKNRQERREKE